MIDLFDDHHLSLVSETGGINRISDRHPKWRYRYLLARLPRTGEKDFGASVLCGAAEPSKVLEEENVGES